MATSPRKTTGKAAPTKGAASAVSPADPSDTASAEEKVTVEQEPAITIDAANPPTDEERELLRSALAADNAAKKEAAQLGVPDTEGIAAAAKLPDATVPGGTVPTVTEGLGGQVGAQVQPPARDLEALRALADTSGHTLVTPYPADDIPAPDPLALLPEPRSTQDWTRDTDTPVTARVLVDGWRCIVNGCNNFAQRGDRITGPDDVMRRAASQGVVYIEE